MMDIQPTQEQIIASALKLPFEQRASIVNALVGTVQDDVQEKGVRYRLREKQEVNGT